MTADDEAGNLVRLADVRAQQESSRVFDGAFDGLLEALTEIQNGGLKAVQVAADPHNRLFFLIGVGIGESAVRERFILAMTELGMSRDAIGEILSVLDRKKQR
jgi:hypothetical protein